MAKNEEVTGREQVLRELEAAEKRGQPAAEDECVVLFADIVGYSTYASRRGDEAALDLVRCFEGAARGPIDDTGGRVVMTAGDAILACWPKDLLADAVQVSERMIEALNEANRERPRSDRIRVRVGIHRGPVMRLQDGDLIGNGVNLACRIQTAALPSEILLSSEAAEAGRACEAMPPTRRLGMMRLKGIETPVEIHRVERTPGEYQRRALHEALTRALLPTQWSAASWTFAVVGALLALGTFGSQDFARPITTAAAFGVLFVGCAMLWAAYRPRTVSRWHVVLRLILVALWSIVAVSLGWVGGAYRPSVKVEKGRPEQVELAVVRPPQLMRP